MTPPTSFESVPSTTQQVETYIASARRLLGAHAPERALEQLRAALTLAPEDADAHALMALALSRLGRTAGALDESKQALHFAPTSAWCHYIRGVVFLQAGRHKDAQAALEHARALSPYNATYASMLAVVFNNQDKPREAEAAAREALELDPHNAIAHLARGYALLDLKRFDEAGSHFQAALQLDPENADNHQGMALWYLRTKRPNEALAAAREALRLEPDHRGARQAFIAAQGRKNPFFRLFWVWSLWLTQFSPAVRLGIIIGLWVVIQALNAWGDKHPQWSGTIGIVSGLYFAFCVYTWVAPSLLRWWIRRGQPY